MKRTRSNCTRQPPQHTPRQPGRAAIMSNPSLNQAATTHGVGTMFTWRVARTLHDAPGRVGERSLPCALLQSMEPIRRQLLPSLLSPARPSHVDAIDRRRGAEAEVDAQIVLRQVTAAAADFLILLDAAGDDVNPGADGIAIRRRPDQFQIDVMMDGVGTRHVEIRPIVDVGNGHVDAAVVVDVAERRAAPGLR